MKTLKDAIELIMAEPPEAHYPSYYASLLREADVPDKDVGKCSEIPNGSDLISRHKMEKVNATLGTRISDLLKQRGLSQRELAKKVGVTEVSMSRYIKGERTPKGPIIANIAKNLHTTADYLLGLDTEETVERRKA